MRRGYASTRRRGNVPTASLREGVRAKVLRMRMDGGRKWLSAADMTVDGGVAVGL